MRKKLAQLDILDAIDTIDVKTGKQSYKAQVTLIRKSYNGRRLGGKKFIESPIYENRNEDDSINSIVYRINAFLKEGHEVLAKDAFILLMYIDDIPCGYYAGTETGRGHQWIVTTPKRSFQCIRFDKPKDRYESNAREMMIFLKSGEILHVFFTQDDTDRIIDDDYIQLSTKYHTLYGESVAYSDAEAISSDVIESLIDNVHEIE